MLGLLALIVGWVALSLVLFLASSHFRRISPPANVASQLEPAGFLLTSANNILVLGSDKRQKDSREPGADINGPSRSDSIMLIRTGGGHAARLSIPRDTVIEIPGHGLQKINAAYAFGGPAESISVIKHYLGVPINHLIEVNFENFPELVDAMGGSPTPGAAWCPTSTAAPPTAASRCASPPVPTTSTARKRSRSRVPARTAAPPSRPISTARNASRNCCWT